MASSKIQTYDISPKMREVIEWKYARKKELRQRYLKEVLNPTKQLMPLDSAIERVTLLRLHHQYVRDVTLKHHAVGGFIFSAVICALTCTIKYIREQNEIAYNAGKVSYADRPFKFV